MTRVFEPYFTTKPVGAGSGLGLAQASAFAKRSGGDRNSKPGGNGHDDTHLFADHSQVPTATEPARAAPRTVRSLEVLMVEDDALVASVVLGALEGAGHRVTLCASADEAHRRLTSGALGRALHRRCDARHHDGS